MRVSDETVERVLKAADDELLVTQPGVIRLDSDQARAMIRAILEEARALTLEDASPFAALHRSTQ